jgi:hypothetical protein
LVLQPTEEKSEDDLSDPSKEEGSSSSTKTTSEKPDAVALDPQPCDQGFDVKIVRPCQQESQDLVSQSKKCVLMILNLKKNDFIEKNKQCLEQRRKKI